MVAPHYEKVLRVLDLVAHEEADRLQAALAPVHVVPGTTPERPKQNGRNKK